MRTDVRGIVYGVVPPYRKRFTISRSPAFTVSSIDPVGTWKEASTKLLMNSTAAHAYSSSLKNAKPLEAGCLLAVFIFPLRDARTGAFARAVA